MVWYFVAVPFRGYARNVVYNYVLANNKHLKRLYERPIKEYDSYYIISPYHGSEGGYITKRAVSWFEYQFVYWFIWGWLDDDSNWDTYDKGHNDTMITGERMKWLPKFIKKSLTKANNKGTMFGNSFDIGDRRADVEPLFSFWSSYLWTVRNTAYNFKYMQWDTDDESRVFLVRKFGMKFGYEPDDIVAGRQNYRLVITKDEQ